MGLISNPLCSTKEFFHDCRGWPDTLCSLKAMTAAECSETKGGFAITDEFSYGVWHLEALAKVRESPILSGATLLPIILYSDSTQACICCLLVVTQIQSLLTSSRSYSFSPSKIGPSILSTPLWAVLILPCDRLRMVGVLLDSFRSFKLASLPRSRRKTLVTQIGSKLIECGRMSLSPSVLGYDAASDQSHSHLLFSTMIMNRCVQYLLNSLDMVQSTGVWYRTALGDLRHFLPTLALITGDYPELQQVRFVSYNSYMWT